MRPTYALIDLDALRANLTEARKRSLGGRLLFAVKADAYGHGIAPVAKAAEPMVDGFAVAFLEEALSLRTEGITKPITVLEGPMEKAECGAYRAHGLWPMIHRMDQIPWLAAAGADWDAVWIKVDTGMSRLGLSPGEAEAALHQIRAGLLVKELVMCTHFYGADGESETSTLEQLARFAPLQEHEGVVFSTTNSAALQRFPQARGDWNRFGIMAYGGNPFANIDRTFASMSAVMMLRSEIIAMRTIEAGTSVGYGGRFVARATTRIGTAAIGYGDGYPRHMPDGAPILVAGHEAALAGRVSMDMITIDMTSLPGTVGVGAEVELWGGNLSVDAAAQHAGTIGYELMTRVSSRVPRRYKGA